jgi:hypothetical protein
LIDGDVEQPADADLARRLEKAAELGVAAKGEQPFGIELSETEALEDRRPCGNAGGAGL